MCKKERYSQKCSHHKLTVEVEAGAHANRGFFYAVTLLFFKGACVSVCVCVSVFWCVKWEYACLYQIA